MLVRPECASGVSPSPDTFPKRRDHDKSSCRPNKKDDDET